MKDLVQDKVNLILSSKILSNRTGIQSETG